MRYDTSRQNWQYCSFRSGRWQNINLVENCANQLIAYRVQLTLACQGMGISVPEVNPDDSTMLPEFYDGTYVFFKNIGPSEI